jgi:hypothetical protein
VKTFRKVLQPKKKQLLDLQDVAVNCASHAPPFSPPRRILQVEAFGLPSYFI